jgi:hypothetical protein
MKRHIARYVSIARLTALALSALCFLQAPVRAQGMTGYIVIFPSVGLAPGQSLRFTLFNPNGEPVRAQAGIHHAGGVQVCLADGSVRAGAFHTFEFKRSEIPLAGEGGTGRIQLYGSVRLSFSETIYPVVASMEVVEIQDGTSNTVFVAEKIIRHIGGNGNDTVTSGFGNDFMTGIVPGQTLRVTLFNQPSSESETQSEPVGGRVKVFDRSGNLIAQSPELAIPQGQFRSFDFDRFALSLPGEPGTNRAQARIKPFYNFKSERLSPVLASFEIVDNRTGKTVVLSGQECLVFYLGGTPTN